MSDFRKAILELLEDDARISAKQIATMLDVTEQQVHDEIASMEQEGIILAYKPIINTDKTEHGEDVYKRQTNMCSIWRWKCCALTNKEAYSESLRQMCKEVTR